jgi:predicted heme/steroid binding protein
MALPITVPYTFGTATSAIPLSNLDSDFATVYAAVNGIGNGTVALANVAITGGSMSNVSVTLDSINNTPIGATTPSTGAFTTLSSSGTATLNTLNLTNKLGIAYGGTNQTAFTSPASSVAGLVWFDGTSFQNDTTPAHVGYNSSTNTFYCLNLLSTNDASINGLTVGKGGGAVSTNTAMGASALSANTSGSFGVAFGSNALYSNTSGASNNAFGAYALYANTTGSNNTAVGSASVGNSPLQANTTGSYNTAIGNNALAANTTASNNTAVGYQALYNANRTADTSGNNTAIGYGAGSNLTTGTGNIFVGLNSSAGAATDSYEIVIGAGITGKGSSTTYIGTAGSIYNISNTSSWNTTSDQRIKKNIADNSDGLNKIANIRVRNFEYRLPEEVDSELKPSDAVNKSGVQLGVIAQELQTVLPECVHQESTGVLSVQTDNLIWYAINAIKELSAEITALKAQLHAANVTGF